MTEDSGALLSNYDNYLNHFMGCMYLTIATFMLGSRGSCALQMDDCSFYVAHHSPVRQLAFALPAKCKHLGPNSEQIAELEWKLKDEIAKCKRQQTGTHEGLQRYDKIDSLQRGLARR